MNQYKHHTENSPTLATCLQAEVVLHERSFALERERGVRLVGIHDRKHRVAPSSAESRGNSHTSAVVCERVASCSCTCLPQSTYGKLMVISATVPYLLGRPGYTAFHVASGSSNPPDAYMEEPQFWHSAIPGWSPRNVLVLAAEAVATQQPSAEAQSALRKAFTAAQLDGTAAGEGGPDWFAPDFRFVAPVVGPFDNVQAATL